MDYLFFDIECANCFSGVGKICEFGYALFDEQFNLLEKKNIYINPESRFHLGPRKNQKEGIELTKPHEYYKSQPTFPNFYDEIKTILTKENTLMFAYSDSNDVGFILSTLIRYNLEVFDFICYDAQKIAYKYTKDFGKLPGLDKVSDLLLKDYEQIPAHEASNDAYMTGLVVKEILKANNATFDEYIADIDGLTLSLLDAYEQKMAKEKLKALINSVTISHARFYNKQKHKGKVYYFTKSISKNQEKFTLALTKLKDMECYTCHSLEVVDYIVYDNDDEKKKYKSLHKHFKTYKLMSFKKFLAKRFR